MFLEDVTPTVSSVISDAQAVGTGVLSFGTQVFNWAMSNPLYVIAIGVGFLGVAIGVVKRFTHK